jgi:hypothetical protein
VGVIPAWMLAGLVAGFLGDYTLPGDEWVFAMVCAGVLQPLSRALTPRRRSAAVAQARGSS